jgi:uncharacterized membrane protein YhiD involved in acid resistance
VDQIFLSSSEQLQLSELLTALAVGTGLAMVLWWHFRAFASTLSNRRGFASVLPLILLTTTLIISIIKVSLVLSLGMVGALSIVRFRTPIKEPEELAYLFLAIGVGVGLGANEALGTSVALAFILLVGTLFKFGRNGLSHRSLYLSLDWAEPDEGPAMIERVETVLREQKVRAELRRADLRDERSEATWLVDVEFRQKASELIAALREALPEVGVTFVDPARLPSD